MMNALRMQLIKHQEGFFRLYYSLINMRLLPCTYATTVDALDSITSDALLLQKDRFKSSSNTPQFSIQRFTESDNKIVNQTNSLTLLPDDEFDETVQQLLFKNKDKQIEHIILQCLSIRRLISDPILKTLLKHYSNAGKPEMIVVIQKYFSKLLPNSYRRNGEFNHYFAKAQCFKGYSEKGLSILKDNYKKNENLRSFYRVIFRDLIHESVLNRSEATLVVFKKYVIEFSDLWEEHYPLVCFWHVCWSSTWYSDQMLSNELWESSQALRDIVRKKVAALSISALRADCNEDAVVRLLQTLLKYEMTTEYTSVLQVLFSYKLRNKDLRGCAEILRNCEVLGITLPSDQQRKYINMLIQGQPNETRAVKPTKDFKLKF